MAMSVSVESSRPRLGSGFGAVPIIDGLRADLFVKSLARGVKGHEESLIRWARVLGRWMRDGVLTCADVERFNAESVKLFDLQRDLIQVLVKEGVPEDILPTPQPLVIAQSVAMDSIFSLPRVTVGCDAEFAPTSVQWWLGTTPLGRGVIEVPSLPVAGLGSLGSAALPVWIVRGIITTVLVIGAVRVAQIVFTDGQRLKLKAAQLQLQNNEAIAVSHDQCLQFTLPGRDFQSLTLEERRQAWQFCLGQAQRANPRPDTDIGFFDSGIGKVVKWGAIGTGVFFGGRAILRRVK